MTLQPLADLLQDWRQAGVFALPGSGREAVRAAADRAGLGFFEVSFDEAVHLGPVLAAIGRDLAFPAWYGANLDALKDCLTDFSWRPAAGYVLVVLHAERLSTRNPAAWEAVNEVFVESVAEWRERHVPMWVLYIPASHGLLTRFPGA